MRDYNLVMVVVGTIVVILYSYSWYQCSSRGGEFIKAPFEIGYRCTK
jgi:hypothetical protein